jgi:hypothetical protein
MHIMSTQCSCKECLYNRGLQPTITWKQGIWYSLHSLAASYNRANEFNDPFVIYVRSIHLLIRCKDPCLDEWWKMTRGPRATYPYPTLTGNNDREKFFMWTVNVHNAVNRRIGKEPMSLEDAKIMYGFVPE